MLCDPLPLSVGWAWWLTVNEYGVTKVRVSCLRWDIKHCDFQLAGLFSLSLSLWLFSLAFCGEASCHIVSCPMERPTWWGTEGNFQQITNKELKPSENGLWETNSCQQPCTFGNGPFPSWAFKWWQPWLIPWPQPVRDSEAEFAVKPLWAPVLQNLRVNKYCLNY